jgi:hypothetical protein
VLAVLAAAVTLLRPGPTPVTLVAGIVLAIALLLVGCTSRPLLRDVAVSVTALLLFVSGQRGIEDVLVVGDTHVEILRRVRAAVTAEREAVGASAAEVSAAEASAAELQILPASWDLGYMIGAVSGLRPAAHPQAINVATSIDGENDARIFWSPESAAAAEAARRGIRFLYIGQRDFDIIEEIPAADRFRVRRRLGFQVPTMSAGGQRGPLPLSIVKHLLVYRMVKEPERLKAWRLFEEAVDPQSGELMRVFELVEPPDPQRTYVFAIFENTAGQMAETQVQLFHDATTGTSRQGARLNSRLRPMTSSMSIFSFAGVEDGKGRAELSNPRVELRLVSHQSGGRYGVDFVRPRRGWRPLEIR